MDWTRKVCFMNPRVQMVRTPHSSTITCTPVALTHATIRPVIGSNSFTPAFGTTSRTIWEFMAKICTPSTAFFTMRWPRIFMCSLSFSRTLAWVGMKPLNGANLIELEPVPVLYRGKWDEASIKACWRETSTFGCEQKGYNVWYTKTLVSRKIL